MCFGSSDSHDYPPPRPAQYGNDYNRYLRDRDRYQRQHEKYMKKKTRRHNNTFAIAGVGAIGAGGGGGGGC
jgi:hypothetical protein